MFCSEHFTGKLDFFNSHFHYNLYIIFEMNYFTGELTAPWVKSFFILFDHSWKKANVKDFLSMFTEKLEFVVLYRFVDIKSEVSDMTELLRKIKYLEMFYLNTIEQLFLFCWAVRPVRSLSTFYLEYQNWRYSKI